MKLVIFGLAVSSSWGNGHATLWRGLCRALSHRGWNVSFFEKNQPFYAAHRDLQHLPGGGSLILYDSWDQVREAAVQQLRTADIAMVTSYCPNGLEATALLDAAPGVKCFYDLDTPVTLENVRDGKADAYIGPRGLRDFDLVLSYTGGHALIELQQSLGARATAPLYGSVDPEVHRPVAPFDEWKNEGSYLGTFSPDRQEILQQIFVEPARRLPDLRFALGGAMYDGSFPWTRNIYFRGHVPPEHHPAFFCSSRLTVNATRRAMAASGYCPQGRLFEAAACGTPILSDTWPGLEQFFEPGEEILTAVTTEDAMDAFGSSDDRLQRIARRARERVLDQHTAAHRAVELERIMGSYTQMLPAQPALAS